MSSPLTGWWKLGLLSSLYFSQGLPFGFFTQALPVWMRQQGMGLALIGASSVLAAPWALKLLWAPLVDRYDGSPLGRRRGWILPLQAASTVAIAMLAVLGAVASPSSSSLLIAMAVAMFVTNFFAATQDIATDALAVDLLSPAERGLGNGVQVAAYRVGMIVGGGALLASFGRLGWMPTMAVMASLIALMSVPMILYKEPRSTTTTTTTTSVGIFASLRYFARGGGRYAVWGGALVLYKFGDALGSPMARTMLVDSGYDVVDIGLLLGTFGSVADMVGALLGGLAARHGRLLALIVCGLVHAALMASYALPVVFVDVDRAVVAGLIVLEHLTGGMATVALFTAMMDASNKQTGASDYTAQASAVVIATGIGGALSGVSAQSLGYASHFVVAGVVCVIGTLTMLPVYRFGFAPREDRDDDNEGGDDVGGAGRVAADLTKEAG